MQSASVEATVLKVLLDPSGGKASLAEIEKMTGLDGRSVKGAITGLRASGVQIDGHGGYSVGNIPDIITPAILLCELKSKIMGRNIHSYKSIGSTNEVAGRLAESGEPEGTIVVADRQTRGRGRLGRTWHSPPGMGLFFSLILRPVINFDRVPGLSLVAALSVCRALEREYSLKPRLKWPNDCLIEGRKVAGILVELSAELDKISHAILGMGINVNSRKQDFPSNLRSKATSVAIATGEAHNRVALLASILAEFEKDYANFVKYGLRFMGRALAERSSVVGNRVTVRLGKRKLSGIALGLDENGALRLKTGKEVAIISAGEVSLR